MIYRQTLIMFKAVLAFCIIVAAVVILIVLVSITQHASNSGVRLGSMLRAMSVVTAIFALIYGCGLGNGSRDAARMFWTLPGARWRSAFAMALIDVAGIVIALLAATAIGLAGVLPFAEGSRILPSLVAVSAPEALLAFGLPLAVYAWSALVGTSLRRIAYSGTIVAPVLLLWHAVASTRSPVFAPLRSLAVLNPFSDFIYGVTFLAGPRELSRDPLLHSLSWATSRELGVILFAIFIVGVALAIARWQFGEIISIETS